MNTTLWWKNAKRIVSYLADECVNVVLFYFENPSNTEMLLLFKPYKLTSAYLLAVL